MKDFLWRVGLSVCNGLVWGGVAWLIEWPHPIVAFIVMGGATFVVLCLQNTNKSDVVTWVIDHWEYEEEE